jgi:anti-sigma factor ChrR (cupin superfamily)
MNVAAKLRARRIEARNRRAVNQALAQAKTPAMRDEILAVAQRQQMSLR